MNLKSDVWGSPSFFWIFPEKLKRKQGTRSTVSVDAVTPIDVTVAVGADVRWV